MASPPLTPALSPLRGEGARWSGMVGWNIAAAFATNWQASGYRQDSNRSETTADCLYYLDNSGNLRLAECVVVVLVRYK